MKVFIYEHVGCNVAVMKGKNVATVMPSKGTREDHPNNVSPMLVPAPPSTSWYPISQTTGIPRAFSVREVDQEML